MEEVKTHIPPWQRDLTRYIDAVPYGEIDVQIKRIDRKTTAIVTVAEETLRYVSNEEALRDLDRLFSKLIDTKFSGDAHVKLQIKDGQIQIIGVFNKKKTNY